MNQIEAEGFDQNPASSIESEYIQEQGEGVQYSKPESETYKSMLDEVEGIVRDISSESLDLDHMVLKVERGYQLIKTMKERLGETKKRIEKLRLDFGEAPDGEKR